MSSFFSAVPADAQARTAQAIAEAFPGGEIQSLTPLYGGQSGALTYRLVVAELPMVLRLIQGNGPLSEPAHQLACMRLAAQQGLAPQLYYASQELGVSISAFIVHQPARLDLQRDEAQLADLGRLLHRLHHGPAFPVSLDVFQLIHGGVEQLMRGGGALPQLILELMAGFAAVERTVRPHLAAAPCHRDLNPGNVLYDGTRCWLIDWEGAGMGEPMFDLACLMHWCVLGTNQEAALLQAYFQRAPSQHELAKLALMKQIAWCYYAIIFLLIAQQGSAAPAAPEPERLSSFAETIRAIRSGALRLHDAATRRYFSLVIAQQALGEMRQPEFAQALAYLAGNSDARANTFR